MAVCKSGREKRDDFFSDQRIRATETKNANEANGSLAKDPM